MKKLLFTLSVFFLFSGCNVYIPDQKWICIPACTFQNIIKHDPTSPSPLIPADPIVIPDPIIIPDPIVIPDPIIIPDPIVIPDPIYIPNPTGLGPAPINLSSNGGVLQAGDLGSAGNYVILAKTGVSNVTGSTIVGNMGVGPAAASYITGFSLIADTSNVFSTSIAVIGKIFAADYAPPTPANMTSAISSMETSYTNGMGRVTPDYTELANGSLGGLTLFPGLYNWSSTVLIATNLTLSGGPNDVFIFQIAGDLTMAANQHVLLIGGVQAKNIFWVVAGQSAFFTGSHFEGILLCKTAVILQTNASINGRIFAQSAVNLDNNAIVQQ
jgi:hypothetical protein